MDKPSAPRRPERAAGAETRRAKRGKGSRTLFGQRAGAFDEDGHAAADEAAVVLAGDLLHEVEQGLVASAFFGRRHVVLVMLGGKGAGARRVLEDERLGEAHAAHEVHRRFEVVLGLAGKADDEVGRDRHVRPRGADHRHAVRILGSRVAALHPGQHRVGPRLGRHVQVRADGGDVAKNLGQAFGHRAGVAGDEVQACEARRFGDLFDEVRQVPGPSVLASGVLVDRLSQERDLPRPLPHQAADFFDDDGGRAAALRAANVRDHAVGAEVVASAHRGNEGVAGRRAAQGTVDLDLVEGGVQRGERVGIARRVEGDNGAGPARSGRVDEVGQFGQAAWCADEVHQRGAASEAVAVLLGHAAEESDHQVRLAAFARLECADVREDAVLGVGADRTRDEQEDPRVGGVVHDAGARGAEPLGDEFGVEPVHLAAVRRDVDADRFHGPGIIEGGARADKDAGGPGGAQVEKSTAGQDRPWHPARESMAPGGRKKHGRTRPAVAPGSRKHGTRLAKAWHPAVMRGGYGDPPRKTHFGSLSRCRRRRL